MSERPAAEETPSWPPVIDGLAYPGERPSFSEAEAAEAVARAEAAAPPPDAMNKGGICYPTEAMFVSLPVDAPGSFQYGIRMRDGVPSFWIAHRNDVAELVVPPASGADAAGDPYADVRTLILRILAERKGL